MIYRKVRKIFLLILFQFKTDLSFCYFRVKTISKLQINLNSLNPSHAKESLENPNYSFAFRNSKRSDLFPSLSDLNRILINNCLIEIFKNSQNIYSKIKVRVRFLQVFKRQAILTNLNLNNN